MTLYQRKIYLVVLLLLLTVCESDNSETKSTSYKEENKIEDRKKNAENILKEAEKKRMERVQKGDTLALKDKELRSFLPREIAGYKPDGDFIGNHHNLSGGAYSNAEQHYRKGDNHLRITLVDYNGRKSPHAEMVAFWEKQRRLETRSESCKMVIIHDTLRGWEVFYKRKRTAELTVAVSDRILLTILADNQLNTEFIKEIAEVMDLVSLAKK